MPSEELPAGPLTDPNLRRARVGRSDVMLVRLQSGEVLAFGAECPHQATSLDDATFWDGKLRCPRHLYLYDPRSGLNVLPARDARPENLWKLKPGYLRVHRVEERDGWIWVDEAPQPPPPGYDAALERRPPGGRRGGRESLDVVSEPVAGAGPVEHADEHLDVALGRAFEIRLPVTPRPGHVWKAEVESGPVRLIEQSFDSADPPCHRLRLTADDVGEATVRCRYARPWDGPDEAAEVRRYLVRIDPGRPPGGSCSGP